MRSLLAALALAFWLPAAWAEAPDPAVLVHLLDYVAVDYPEAVRGGRIRDEAEYREMTEFAAGISEGIPRLEDRARKPELVAAAARLSALIAGKAEPAAVANAAGALRQALVSAYGVALGPRRAPDLRKARALFAEHCASCHGANGRGDGALAKGMDPAPSDFHDADRQRRRSVHGLYNTITLGVEGTAMRAFRELSEADRWALAYLAASWGVDDEAAARGKALWAQGRHRDALGTHAAVAGATSEQVEAALGRGAADVLAHLRRAPEVLDAARPDPIEFARAKVRESAELHAAGRGEEALRAALTAYLEGFELAEAALAAVDDRQVRRVEALMMEYRNAIRTGASGEAVRGLAAEADAALAEAARALSGPGLSPAASAVASFVILLREGLEAVLVVAALLAFLRRTGRTRSMAYLHAGWISALVAGAATWAAATWLVDVSGAQREVTEGVAALAASAMLLYVGFWLHDKSHAGAWQAFVMRGASAVGPGAAWGLALVAFVAVYREVFETVLFYQALWAQAPDAGAAIVAGFALAAVTLAALTWALLRYSVRLPLGLFFGGSGILLAALAVVLAGNGVAALQEAGVVPASPVAFVAVPWLGIHPNVQALFAQLAVTLVVIALFTLSRRRSDARPVPGRPAS